MRDQASAEATLARLALQPALSAVFEALAPAPSYLVGGLVRDAFLEGTDTDYDIATPLPPGEVLNRCAAASIKTVETGVEHGTVLAVIDAVHIEITTFREPSDRSQHTTARDIVTDLSGRDFTLNALAFDVAQSKILDPYMGIEDLQRDVVRGVGSPAARFVEDPLRILRMIRFGPAQGRCIDPATEGDASSHVHLLTQVSPERIKVELEKILLSAYPESGIRTLHRIGALPYTLPELIPAVGFEQNRFHTQDVFEHTLTVLSRTPPDPVLRWAAVFHDVGKPHTLTVDEDGDRHFYLHEVESTRLAKERMRELRFSNNDADAISLLVREHMRPMDCGAPGVRRIIRDLGEQYPRWRSFKWADISPTQPEEDFATVASRFDDLLASEKARLAEPAYGKLAVNGDDLKSLGMSPGPELGAILKALIELVLDDPTRNVREILLQEAQKIRSTPQT